MRYFPPSFDGESGGLGGRKRAKKVFVGLNWYGYDYKLPQEGSEAILGSTCVEVLKRHRPKFR